MSEAPIIGSSVLASEQLSRAFRALLSMEPEKLRTIAKEADAEGGFALVPDALANLAKALDLPPTELAEVLGLADAVYRAVISREASPDQLISELKGLNDVIGVEGFESRRAALADLFSPKGSYDRERAKRLAATALPMLDRAQCWVDLRAVGTGDQTAGYVPVTLFRLSFDEPVAGQDYLVFQLGDDELTKLESTVRDARKLLDDLKEKFAGDIL